MEVDINTDKFIADCEHEAREMKKVTAGKKGKNNDQTVRDLQWSDDMIRHAEAAKIQMLATPGMNRNNAELCVDRFYVEPSVMHSAMQHSSMVDERYLMIGTHVDQNLTEKIIRGDYIDFARLLPKQGSIGMDSEEKLELVYKNGQTYFVPARDRDSSGITSFHKWEQVFRVFSNIYLKGRPDRASELIQYNHVIFTASNTYIWTMFIDMTGSLGNI